MLGDYDGAIDDANRALEIRPGYENALNNRATAYIFKENFEDALQDIDAVLAIDSSRTAVMLKRIMAFERLNNYEGVFETYLMLIREEPDQYEHYGKAGEALYRMDRNEEAISYFTKAMELNRQYYQPLMLRGNAYFKLKDYKNALTDFTRFAQITSDPSAFYNQGMCHLMLNETPEACKSWQKALDLGHQSAEARIREHCR
jgi:tetratricopeptide (TPR) repeat protein